MTASLRQRSGALRPAPEWAADADDVDADVLRRAVGPTLDIGCGPGRHAAALARAGHVVLGIDIADAAMALARRRGVVTLERSVFDRVPGHSRWMTALLLDGNVGIGGDPEALLARVRELLAPGGTVLVEAGPPGTVATDGTVCIEVRGRRGPWFELATRSIDDVVASAGNVGYSVVEVWCARDRWFAALRAP